MLLLCMMCGMARAQIIDPKQTTKSKATNRANNRVDQSIDKGLDKIEEGIGSIFKKKDKKQKSNGEQEEEIPVENETSSDDVSESGEGATGTKPSGQVKSNSKFDFVAGEKVLYFDNFDRLNVGDFPAEFNTNASGEVVILEGKEGKWLNMSKNGFFLPENVKALPDNFTLEFEAGINTDPSNNYSGLGLNFTTNMEDLTKEMFFSKGTSVVYLHPGAKQADIHIIPKNGVEMTNEIPMPQWDVAGNKFVKVSVWRQKGRLRVYLNESKIIDAPRFFSETETYYSSFFRRFFYECELYMTNIRYAVAGSDMRSKLITEGKFVTNGILFDVNSDRIRPESDTVLKEIGTVLQENPSISVRIVGHTDSDGADDANLILSRKRAVSVKNALVSRFGIDAALLTTEGKGESEPLNGNKSPEEKAQNRRVEFIRQ